jgi:hypothetical protein
VIRSPEIRTKQSVIHREPETNSARTAETAENLTRTGSMADGSIDPLLQFSTEHGQMLGVAITCGRFFGGFSYCPFTVHFVPETGYIRWNGLKQAKRLTARIDSKHAGLALTV